MNSEEFELLRKRFRRIFQAKWDPSELANFEDLREKFAFHMSDIGDNLCSFVDAYRNSDDTSVTEKMELFFYHCMPHLIAAAQIYDEVPNIFEEQNGVHDWDNFVDDSEPGD